MTLKDKVNVMESKDNEINTTNEEIETHEPYYTKKPEFKKEGASKLRQHFSNGMTYFLIVVTCVVLYFALLRFEAVADMIGTIVDVTKPVLYGFAIAFLLNPIVKSVDAKLIPRLKEKMELEKAQKLSRTVGVVLALLFLIALISALCNMLIPELYKSIRDMLIALPGQLTEASANVENFLAQDTTMGAVLKNALEQLADSFGNWVRTDFIGQMNTLVSNVTVGVVNVVGEVFNFVLGLIVSVYVLFGKERFSKHAKKLTYAFFSTNHANLILHLTKKSNQIFGGFIIGKIIDSVIIGILCFICLTIMNMPYTLLVSVIVGVTNVIPFFGPFIGAIPSAILIILADPMKGLYFIIFILILQQVDGNVIGPKILGDSTGVSAFGVIFSILIGGGLFGFVGMIMAVPTYALGYYVLMMFTDRKLEKKDLPVDVEKYDEFSYVNDKGVYMEGKQKEVIKTENTEN